MIVHEINPILKMGFAKTCRFLLKRQFEDVLLDRESAFGGEKPWPRQAELNSGIFFIVSHTSWWDAILAGELCLNQQGLRAIGPMDSAQLQKNALLNKVGIFGTDAGDGQAVERMLAEEFARYPDTCVWTHAQGQFAPNELPQPEFKSGVSRWSNQNGYHRIPVAIHYAFGPQRKPNVFVRFGTNVAADETRLLNEDRALLRDRLNSEVKSLIEQVSRAHQGNAAHYENFFSLFNTSTQTPRGRK